MSYRLYTDKNEDFSCEVSVKNASLKGSIARLIIESPDNVSLVFNGKIEGDKCVVPVRRLKGLLDENTRGKMHLEIVVEDTYFKPWESDFLVEEHTSVKVKVNENKQSSNKPLVKVKVNSIQKILKENKQKINIYTPIKEISTICEKFGIKRKNIIKRKEDFLTILKEYFSYNPEYKNYKKTILSNIGNFLT
jgi:hypothetical protein